MALQNPRPTPATHRHRQISRLRRGSLALSVASLLEPRGEQRYERYRQTKKLYETRSKAVHGAELNDDAIRQHVIQSRKLLSDLICHMLDVRKVMSREEIERIVLG